MLFKDYLRKTFKEKLTMDYLRKNVIKYTLRVFLLFAICSGDIIFIPL